MWTTWQAYDEEMNRALSQLHEAAVDSLVAEASISRRLSPKPSAASSKQIEEEAKENGLGSVIVHDCLKIMRTLLADPNASRCARALWAQRREIEELGAADPAAWCWSARVTLL